MRNLLGHGHRLGLKRLHSGASRLQRLLDASELGLDSLPLFAPRGHRGAERRRLARHALALATQRRALRLQRRHVLLKRREQLALLRDALLQLRQRRALLVCARVQRGALGPQCLHRLLRRGGVASERLDVRCQLLLRPLQRASFGRELRAAPREVVFGLLQALCRGERLGKVRARSVQLALRLGKLGLRAA